MIRKRKLVIVVAGVLLLAGVTFGFSANNRDGLKSDIFGSRGGFVCTPQAVAPGSRETKQYTANLTELQRLQARREVLRSDTNVLNNTCKNLKGKMKSKCQQDVAELRTIEKRLVKLNVEINAYQDCKIEQYPRPIIVVDDQVANVTNNWDVDTLGSFTVSYTVDKWYDVAVSAVPFQILSSNARGKFSDIQITDGVKGYPCRYFDPAQSMIECDMLDFDPIKPQGSKTFELKARLWSNSAIWDKYQISLNGLWFNKGSIPNNPLIDPVKYIMNIEVVDSTPSICTDSDGGVIYNEKGKVHGLEAPNVWDDWVDYCGVAGEETGKLVEYSCEQNDYGKKNLYECPNGCSDGACIQTMPSVTVLSPNGGEYYNNDGSPINVTWSTKNVPSNFTFDVIRLRGYPNGGEIILSQNVTNDGSDVISFKGVPAGEYTLEMKAYLNGVLVMDSSDSSFTVIASTNVTQIQSSHFSTPVDAANTLARLRIIMDYSANPSNYRVDQVIIRQEYLKIMLSAMKLIPAASYQCQNIFSDISEPWICAVAETALANGLISKQTNEAGQTLFRGADALSVYEILVLNLKSQCIKPESTSISWIKSTVRNLGITNADTLNMISAATRGDVYVSFATFNKYFSENSVTNPSLFDASIVTCADRIGVVIQDPRCILFPELCQ